jgi:ABC-type uncharacterized transport system involved in gliding motility auxiliary subunit
MSAREHWKRRMLTGTNALFVTLLVMGIVAAAVELSARYRYRIDLSEDAMSTLLPQTEAVLDTLDRQDITVRITAFSAQRKGQESFYKDRAVRDLLRELELASPRVETRFVDFDQDRLTAESLGVSRYGTVVVEGRGDRVDIVDRDLFRRRGKDQGFDFLGEPIVAKALTQVVSDSARRVYFLEGHGEKRLGATGPDGFAGLSTLLQNQGWSVESLNLLRDAETGTPPTVPEEASAVVMVGPTGPLSSQEELALREFVARGGHLGVFVDPGGVVPELVRELGVTVPSGVVFDTVAIFPHEDRPVLGYRPHPITQELADANTTTMVAHAAPLDLASLEGVRADVLMTTSRRGWVERGFERPATYDQGTDGPGPVAVAVAIMAAQPHPAINRGRVARLLVMGDTDVLTDELLGEGPGNATFAVNTMRWLVGDDDRMSLVGRPSQTRRIALSTGQLAAVQWVVLGLMPLLAVLVGAIVWWTRRDR